MSKIRKARENALRIFGGDERSASTRATKHEGAGGPLFNGALPGDRRATTADRDAKVKRGLLNDNVGPRRQKGSNESEDASRFIFEASSAERQETSLGNTQAEVGTKARNVKDIADKA